MNNPHHSASPLRSRSLLAKPEANWYPVGAVKGGLEMSRIQVDDLVPGEEGGESFGLVRGFRRGQGHVGNAMFASILVSRNRSFRRELVHVQTWAVL